MKKVFVMLLAIIMCTAIIACDESGNVKETDTTDKVGETIAIQSDTEPVSDTEALSDTENAVTAETEPVITLREISNIGDYSIVYSDDVKDAATELCADIYIEADIMLPLNAAEQEYEFIVGRTDREIEGIDLDALGLGDYIIKAVGNKIVICGGSKKATEAAELYFSMNYLSEGKVYMPEGDGYHYISDTIYDSITVDGVSITEYRVISDLFYGETAENFTDTLENILCTDIELEQAAELKELGEKYILLDDTNTDFTSHEVKIENGNIILYANYVTIEDCIDYFFGEMLGYDTEKGRIVGERSVALTSGMGKTFTLEKKEVYSKEKLLEVLTDVYNSDNIIVGQHMSAYRYGETLSAERGLYLENLGVDSPLFGFDVAEAQASSEYTWNAQVKDAYDMVEYAREGGIFTFSSHFNNPSGLPEGLAKYRGELGDGTAAAWDLLFTEGSDYYNTFMADLAYAADFLEIFHNNGVPIIWRPLHEMNGNWFWFCIVNGEDDNLIPSEYAAKLWIMIYDYLVYERGLDSLIWEYSPNVATGNLGSKSSVMYCYPGDEYCDIVGCDWYTSNYRGHSVLEKSERELQVTGKIFSVTEFGASGDIRTDFSISPNYGFTCSDLDNLITEVSEAGIKTCYWMLWSSWAQVKISLWNMGDGEFFYENEAYLTLEDTYKLLYE